MPQQTNFAVESVPAGVDVKVRDFISRSRLFFILSAVLIVLSILSTFTGVDIALEFRGGTIITYSYVGDIDAGTVQDAVEDVTGTNVTVQEGDSLDSNTHTLSLSFTSSSNLTVDLQSQVTDAIASAYPDSELEILDSNDVSPTAGTEFFTKCIVAAIFAAIILIIYIALRFKQISGWSAGVCAVLGLLSTLIVTYGGVVLMRFEIDSNFMAVILTLLGYAINDTIVIYDRIRENQTVMPGLPIEQLVNISNSQSVRRTLQTSITTFFSMLVVTIIAIATGLDSILSFSAPMMVGIVMGTFNSMCFVPALWVWWQKKRGVTTLKPVQKKRAARV